MNKYEKKYNKYKDMYLKLKGQTGGVEPVHYVPFEDPSIVKFNLDLNYCKDFFRRLINEQDCEYLFTVTEKNEDDNMICEIYKGVSIASAGKSLFKEKATNAYIKMHTHPNTPLSKDWKYLPPSSSDYGVIIDDHFKYQTKKHLILSPEGVYEVSLGKKLLDMINSNYKLKMVSEILPKTWIVNYSPSTDEWNELSETIDIQTNTLHKLLAQPPELIKDDPTIKDRQINLDQYLANIRSTGFDINFYAWASDLTIKMEIDKGNYEFIKFFMHLKSSGEIPIRPGYFYISKTTDFNDLFKRLVDTEEGELVVVV